MKKNLIGYEEGNSISTIKTNKTPKNNKVIIEKEVVNQPLSKVEIAASAFVLFISYTSGRRLYKQRVQTSRVPFLLLLCSSLQEAVPLPSA